LNFDDGDDGGDNFGLPSELDAILGPATGGNAPRLNAPRKFLVSKSCGVH